jgi:hypothetical protein
MVGVGPTLFVDVVDPAVEEDPADLAAHGVACDALEPLSGDAAARRACWR